jgi:hypothetical protein
MIADNNGGSAFAETLVQHHDRLLLLQHFDGQNKILDQRAGLILKLHFPFTGRRSVAMSDDGSVVTFIRPLSEYGHSFWETMDKLKLAAEMLKIRVVNLPISIGRVLISRHSSTASSSEALTAWLRVGSVPAVEGPGSGFGRVGAVSGSFTSF